MGTVANVAKIAIPAAVIGGGAYLYLNRDDGAKGALPPAPKPPEGNPDERILVGPDSTVPDSVPTSGSPLNTEDYAPRPYNEIRDAALEAFSKFAPGWGDTLRARVVAAAVAGPRALGDIRPAMTEAFDAFGRGWGDAPRAAVVGAALLGERPTEEIRGAILAADRGFGTGWSNRDRAYVMAAAAMGNRTPEEISEAMAQVFEVFPASSGWTDNERAEVLAAAVAGNRDPYEIRDALLEASSVFADGWSDADRVAVFQAAVGDEASTKLATVRRLLDGIGEDDPSESITAPPGSNASGNQPAVAVPNSDVNWGDYVPAHEGGSIPVSGGSGHEGVDSPPVVDGPPTHRDQNVYAPLEPAVPS